MMILLNPGPANTTATVKEAMTRPDICPREKEFGQVMLRVRDRLAEVVAPGDDDFTAVIFCGSGTSGVEAAVSSTVPPDGRLLVIDNGAYGKRMAQMAAAYGIPHDVECFGVGGYPDCDRVAALLGGGAYTHLAVVHHETSTGMLNPVPQLGASCKAHGVEMIVVLGAKPGFVPMGPISEALKSEKRNLRGPSPDYLKRCEDVLRLLAEGKNATAIGRELKISRRQVARVVKKESDRLKAERL